MSKSKAKDDDSATAKNHGVKSLLENELGVSLPLHISLSRPLVLKTEQKDAYLSRLTTVISESNVKAFDVQPKDLAWHGNENSTRWFLVMRSQQAAGNEMRHLLEASNHVANAFTQPLLYASKDKRGHVQTVHEVENKFHISVAWSLQGPVSATDDRTRRRSVTVDEDDLGVPYELLGRLGELKVNFSEVKVRMGQDVHTVPLKTRR